MFHARSLAFLALGALAARADAQTGPVLYALDDPAGYTEGCYPPCLCPIFFVDDVSGTFVMQYAFSDLAGYDHYDVTLVDWMLQLGGPRHVTGQGHYRRGGQVAIQEQLTLDLSVNGAALEHFDSGLVAPQAQFPRIAIAVSLNGMVCYDKVYEVVASRREAGNGYCFGSGTATACPCGNSGATGNGCANSQFATGANLIGTGTPSLASDSVVLASTSTPDSSVLFFQGTQRIAGGAGVVFGDGLRCAGGTVTRLRIVTAIGGDARVPGPLDPPLSSMGGITAPGTYDYQAWYRNPAAFCTSATFNLTNGYEIAWSS